MIRSTGLQAACFCFVCLTISADHVGAQTPTAAPSSAPAIAPPQVPTIAKPIVKMPTVAAPTTPSTSEPTFNTSPQKSANIAPAYDEISFKSASESGNTILLIFSGAADTIWLQQAPVLHSILKESEFSRIPVFQIDATNAELMSRFSTTVPGTLLLMKSGVERLRSTRMVKPDAIRKMLRLHTAL